MNNLIFTWISYHSERSEEDLKAYYEATKKMHGEHYWDHMTASEITEDIKKYFEEKS